MQQCCNIVNLIAFLQIYFLFKFSEGYVNSPLKYK